MMQQHYSGEPSPRRMVAIVVSDIDLDHAIMEICLRARSAINRRRITLDSLHGRISVFV